MIGALEDVFDKVFVVDVAVLVLEWGDEVLHVHLLHLFPQGSQQMAEFGRGDGPVGVFVENSVNTSRKESVIYS